MANIVTTERFDYEHYSSLRVAAVDDNGTALSKGVFKYVTSSFGRGCIKTMIAGGINTPVHYRRGGNIRKMFETMHAEAVTEGAAVALLHPFSFSYYRMFGYEKVSDHLLLHFPTRMIDFVPRKCDLVPYDPSMLGDLISVYTKFAVGRQLMLKRFDDKYYKDENKLIYLYYENGEPSGYIIFSGKKEFVINHMANGLLTVHEMCYTSPQALRAIFSFLRMFEGQYDDIELANVAMCPEVELLLRHYTHTSYTAVPDIMAKTLNTEMMLSAADYPNKEGGFTVKVVDTMPSVDGTFKVSYGGGDCKVERVEATPDLTLDAPVFTRFIYGYDGVSADTARYIEGVEISGNADGFFTAFPKKPCGVYEHF